MGDHIRRMSEDVLSVDDWFSTSPDSVICFARPEAMIHWGCHNSSTDACRYLLLRDNIVSDACIPTG